MGRCSSKTFRIYADIPLSINGILHLSQTHQHYLSVVLRLQVGDKFRIFNSDNGEYLARIIGKSKTDIEIVIEAYMKPPTKTAKLILALSIIKADKMMDAINMAVQLGITEITPILAERSQNRVLNSERFIKCLIEATEQSERINVPILNKLVNVKDYIEQVSIDTLIIYANEHEKVENNMKLIENYPDSVSLLIGPEGGFAPSELEILSQKSNAISVSLGSNVLRTETAVTTALAQIQLLRN